jgi:hypothetical protein
LDADRDTDTMLLSRHALTKVASFQKIRPIALDLTGEGGLALSSISLDRQLT